MAQKVRREDEFLAALPLDEGPGKWGKPPPAPQAAQKQDFASFRKQYAEFLFGEIDRQYDQFEKMFKETSGFKTVVASGILESLAGNEKQHEQLAAHRSLHEAFINLENSILDIYGCKNMEEIAGKTSQIAGNLLDYVKAGNRFTSACAAVEPTTADYVNTGVEFASIAAIFTGAGALARGMQGLRAGGKAAAKETATLFGNNALNSAGRAAVASAAMSASFTGLQILSDQSYNAMLEQYGKNPKKGFEMLRLALGSTMQELSKSGIEGKDALAKEMGVKMRKIDAQILALSQYEKKFDPSETAKFFAETFVFCFVLDMGMRGAMKTNAGKASAKEAVAEAKVRQEKPAEKTGAPAQEKPAVDSKPAKKAGGNIAEPGRDSPKFSPKAVPENRRLGIVKKTNEEMVNSLDPHAEAIDKAAWELAKHPDEQANSRIMEMLKDRNPQFFENAVKMAEDAKQGKNTSEIAKLIAEAIKPGSNISKKLEKILRELNRYVPEKDVVASLKKNSPKTYELARKAILDAGFEPDVNNICSMIRIAGKDNGVRFETYAKSMGEILPEPGMSFEKYAKTAMDFTPPDMVVVNGIDYGKAFEKTIREMGDDIASIGDEKALYKLFKMQDELGVPIADGIGLFKKWKRIEMIVNPLGNYTLEGCLEDPAFYRSVTQWGKKNQKITGEDNLSGGN